MPEVDKNGNPLSWQRQGPYYLSGGGVPEEGDCRVALHADGTRSHHHIRGGSIGQAISPITNALIAILHHPRKTGEQARHSALGVSHWAGRLARWLICGVLVVTDNALAACRLQSWELAGGRARLTHDRHEAFAIDREGTVDCEL